MIFIFKLIESILQLIYHSIEIKFSIFKRKHAWLILSYQKSIMTPLNLDILISAILENSN